MDSTELKYCIALTMLNKIGPVNARNLVAYLGSPEAVFAEKESSLCKIPGIGEILASHITDREKALARADDEVDFVTKYNIDTHFFTDPSYPYRLKECPDAPILLYSKGTKDFNNGRFLSIVGTRKITPYGKEICQNLLRDLAQTQPNLVIVSGLAYGVDVAAHKAALEFGLNTFGVVAHGLDRIYPSANRQVAQRMIESGGAVITEFTSGTEPLAPNFVSRNRIVAGMCDAVLVVESALKGGSLITAELANDYNRDVFAVPGRSTDVQSQGCNNLIYQNRAVLVQTAADLEKFMNWDTETLPRERQQELFDALTADEQTVIDTLRTEDSVYINHLATRTQLPLQKLLALLVQMEFKGLIDSLPGSYYKVKR